MNQSRVLNLSLTANAAFSALSGLLLTFFASPIGGWLGVSIDGWLRLLGLVLLGHSAILTWVLTQADNTRWAKLNLAAIAPYPLIMLGLVASGVVEPAAGQALVLGDGLIVGLFAISQWFGLRTQKVSVDPEPA